MPAILTALTDEQIAAFRAGDEDSFARIVRARFDALTERARIELGDDSPAAPRVALSVLLTAWQDRTQIENAAALDDFLTDAVPRRCADERRKRASLHRFEMHEGVHVSAPAGATGMTAEQAWEEISLRLHVSAEELEEHRQESRRLARQHAREHVDTIGKRGVPWGMVAGGIALLAFAAFGLRFMDRGSAEIALTNALAGDDVRTVQASAGQRGTISLTDASDAELAAGSTLRIPAEFGRAVRGLELSGAARFSVSPDRSPDFQVRARGVGVVATGTVFDLRAYDDESYVIVRAREGEVEVHPQAGKSPSHHVSAGDAIMIGADGQVRTPTEQELAMAFSWTDGSLVLQDVTLDRALLILRRWHDVDAQLADASMGQRTVTVNLTLESAGLALDALTRAAHLEVSYDGQQMVLRDAATAEPPAAGDAKPLSSR